jgi:hypothetical protein
VLELGGRLADCFEGALRPRSPSTASASNGVDELDEDERAELARHFQK